MKRIFVLAAAAMLTAPAAYAGAPVGSKLAPVVDPIITAPAPIMAPRMARDWTGPYAGATLGFARTRADGALITEEEAEEDEDLIAGTRRFFREGQFGVAGHVGYNMDLGGWVVGGELALAPGFNTEVGTREVRWGASARIKAGPKLGADGATWLFGTLGAAHVRHRLAEDARGIDGDDDARSSNGWLIGVGVSHMVTDNVFVTGEIGQTRFRGDDNVRSTGAALGVSFRF